MTGNCAMEELLFLKMPKWMVAVALQNRMSDTEVISVTVARQYSRINGCGSEFEFGGEHQTYLGDHRLPRVVAIDAIRGGVPALTELAILRDVNKLELRSMEQQRSQLAIGAVVPSATTTIKP